jgi:hypothetical protein
MGRLLTGQTIKSTAVLISIWLVLAAVIHFSHVRMLALLANRQAGTADSGGLIPQAAVIKPFTLGYDQLIADCWWLAFVQYYGNSKAREKDHCRLAYNYLDLITQLDPRFTLPYWFSAFAVGSEGKRPDLAEKIIDRGVRSNQDDWYLPFIAGVNLYLFAHNDRAAAKYYRAAARYPNAPKWLSREADILEARMPTLLKQVNTWASIYNSSDDLLVKREAAAKLQELWLTIYRTVPSQAARERAVAELKLLGVEVIQEEKK